MKDFNQNFGQSAPTKAEMQSEPQVNKIPAKEPEIEESKTNNQREKQTQSMPRAPNMDFQNATDTVLRLITKKPMTSRDIQITLGRSREHTSRLMKKLFQEGFVNRNTTSKPYTYSLTDKGKQKIGILNSQIEVKVS